MSIMLNIINPATEEIITSLPADNAEMVKMKYTAARHAQKEWAQTTVGHRVGIIQKFNDLLEQHKTELTQILTSEVGKPLQQSVNEINGARKRISFFVANSAKYLADEVVHQEEGMTEILAHEPLGVVANISAWNYPYLVGVNAFIPALIAGNTVLYKPSEFSTLTGHKIGELLHEAGVPLDAFIVVTGAREAGEALLDLPLDGYFFTGSYRTGKYIYERVAPKMVPCQLELGGKDPLYVTDDVADVKSAAASAADGAFYNNGQSCCSVERIYVHEKVYDEFIEEFIKETNSYKLGLPTEEGVYHASLTRGEQIKVLEQQVQDAVSKGAKLLTGGHRMDRKGYYFEPTVLVDVNHNMSVMKDESFGPIIGIQKVKNDEEAIDLMQDTEYGLTSAVYTASRDRADSIMHRLNSGTVYWNCCDRLSPYLPWSGRKHSGIGVTLSYLGIRAFTRPKAYHMRG